jgi:hypothetical protein
MALQPVALAPVVLEEARNWGQVGFQGIRSLMRLKSTLGGGVSFFFSLWFNTLTKSSLFPFLVWSCILVMFKLLFLMKNVLE